MYMNKPLVTKIEAADRVNLLRSTSCRLAKCLYPCPDMRHFMMVTKKLLLSDIEFKH